MTDYGDYKAKSKTKSRARSHERKSRERVNKVSAFEKFEEIRFAAYELHQKLKQL